MEKALVPKPTLLDGRTEADRLRFLVDFSTVLNFYNSDNKIYDNWAPFLLKDPVFLLAFISKTNKENHFDIFNRIRNLSYKAINSKKKKKKGLEIINQLFLQLFEVFLTIERWSHYMGESDVSYKLKKYVYQEVEDTYSGEFWALDELHQYLRRSKQIGRISKIPYSLEAVKQNKVWSDPKSKKTNWEILELYYPLDTNTKYQIYRSLVHLGDRLFTFYHKIIDYAGIEFLDDSVRKDKFPDTLLLRTFTRLMMIHQEQLNTISNKHLSFYYSDILKQKRLDAVADKVFVVAELAKKESAFVLKKGALFAGGKTADNHDINFKSIDNVELSPTNILNSYTLFAKSNGDNQETASGNYSSLFLEKIADPGKLKKNQEGLIKPWPTFGSDPKDLTRPATLGIAFSSPLLYLKEGVRVITITLNFTSPIDVNLLANAKFYLSSPLEWIEVTKLTKHKKYEGSESQSFTLTISLPVTFSSVEKFNADIKETQSEWPLFKMVFSEFIDLEAPPELNKLDISVEVTGVNQLELYNDFGDLSPKAPFQILGPTASKGSNFYLGSAELFSKPLDEFKINVEWDELPQNFGTYYDEYNDYLENKLLDLYKPNVAANGSNGGNKQDDEDNGEKDNGENGDENETDTNHEEDNGDTNEEDENVVNDPAAEEEAEEEIDDEKKIEEVGKNILSRFEWGKKLLKQFSKVKAFLSNSMISKIFKGKINFGIFGKMTAPILKALAPISKILTPRLVFLLSLVKNLFLEKEDEEDEDDQNGDGTKGSQDFTDTLIFENNSFKVGFNVLVDGDWKNFNVQNNANPDINEQGSLAGSQPIVITYPPTLLFDTDIKNNTVLPNSSFLYKAAKGKPNMDFVNQNLQGKDLTFSEKSNSGFLSMTLDQPQYGFGSQIYPQVVSLIALYNATIVSEDNPDLSKLKKAPSSPFITKVKKISANYNASFSYALNFEEDKYPLECYYSTPFNEYLSYDNSRSAVEYIEDVSFSIGNPIAPPALLPIIPSFAFKGSMFVELDSTVLSGKVNLFFELSQNVNQLKRIKDKSITYNYLSDHGWKPLTIISDSTMGFSCSGIITVDLPDDISSNFSTMPSGSYWLFIGVNNEPGVFSETVLLKVNGFELERVVSQSLDDTTAPQIKGGSISATVAEVPEISTISQPFPSFGGRAMESISEMNRRVSSRLRTKNRVVSHQDYYQIVLERFPSIFFVKSYYDAQDNKVKVYALRKFDSYLDANAFNPSISECKEIEIKNALTKIGSPFTIIEVLNFIHVPVTIAAKIGVEIGFSKSEVKDKIKSSLNIFLSPWITSESVQIKIDGGLKASDVAAFIKTIPGVSQVSDVSLSANNKSKLISINLDSASELLVSSLNFDQIEI